MRRWKAPDLYEEKRGRCGRRMWIAQGEVSACCCEAVREIHGRPTERLRLDRVHREGKWAWI